jgi:Homeodomain-like domain
VQLTAGWRDVEIARALEGGVGTVANTRQRFLAGGRAAVLQDKLHERHRQALTGAQLAHRLARACRPAPNGHDHWTLRLLAGKAVARGLVAGIAPETIRQARKKARAVKPA